MEEWIHVSGTLIEGYRVASGPSKDYPYGALEKQRPIFRQRGLDLESYFNGTLNVDISPMTFALVRPRFTFRQVEWTDLHPPEDFSFSACRVVFENAQYDGWIYYPHPETKLRHFQNPSLVEIIARPIPGIAYGDRLEILLDPIEVQVK